MQVHYTATAIATGGRRGHIYSSDGVLGLQLVYPKELGGPGEGTNPAQLFAAGYAACFENALLRVAREQKAPLDDSSVTAHVGIGRETDGYLRLVVTLEVSVPGRDWIEVEDMARTAHEEVCSCSRATRGNIEVTVRVV
jgi:Ohr subfamily peroxiredoxin